MIDACKILYSQLRLPAFTTTIIVTKSTMYLKASIVSIAWKMKKSIASLLLSLIMYMNLFI